MPTDFVLGDTVQLGLKVQLCLLLLGHYVLKKLLSLLELRPDVPLICFQPCLGHGKLLSQITYLILKAYNSSVKMRLLLGMRLGLRVKLGIRISKNGKEALVGMGTRLCQLKSQLFVLFV